MEKQITTSRFMIIDDDSINNHICSKYICIIVPDANIQAFTDPQKALDYIQSAYPIPGIEKTILFLDINMPVLSGWDVLDRFINFPETIKEQFKIFILSSSVAAEDKLRANNNPFVSGFLEKPLSVQVLQKMFSEC